MTLKKKVWVCVKINILILNIRPIIRFIKNTIIKCLLVYSKKGNLIKKYKKIIEESILVINNINNRINLNQFKVLFKKEKTKKYPRIFQNHQ